MTQKRKLATKRKFKANGGMDTGDPLIPATKGGKAATVTGISIGGVLLAAGIGIGIYFLVKYFKDRDHIPREEPPEKDVKQGCGGGLPPCPSNQTCQNGICVESTPPPPANAEPVNVGAGEYQEDLNNTMLNKTNKVRSIYNVNNLTINQDMAVRAQRWAKYLASQKTLMPAGNVDGEPGPHGECDPGDTDVCNPITLSGSKGGVNWGQNVSTWQGPATEEEAIEKGLGEWTAECSCCEAGKGHQGGDVTCKIEFAGTGQTAHFTQVINNQIGEMGCGMANDDQYNTVVCLYNKTQGADAGIPQEAANQKKCGKAQEAAPGGVAKC